MVVGPALKQLGTKAHAVLRTTKAFGRQNARATQDVLNNNNDEVTDNHSSHLPPVSNNIQNSGQFTDLPNGGRLRFHFKNVVPSHYLCPITHEIMEDPVTVASGHTFERKAIVGWFNDGNDTNPVTGQKLENTNVK